MKAAVVTAIVLGLIVVVVIRSNAPTGEVRAYCDYGSVSRVQWQGCVDHVSEARIDGLDTSAARFARGEQGCGSDAGPFCRDVTADESEPRP